MTTLTLVAALFSLALTLFVVWANPYRFSNQVFALVLFIQTAWLGCVYRAMQIGANPSPENAEHLEWWFRTNAAVISFLPAAMWLLKCAITVGRNEKRKAIYASLPLFALCMFSAGLCLTPSFVSQQTTGFLNRGAAYYVYIMTGITIFAACVIGSLRAMLACTGIRRVELQFLALSNGASALLLLGLNALGNFLNIRALNRISVLLVFIASVVTVCALLMHRVFNAWEIFLQLAQRLWFALILSGGIYVMWFATANVIAEPFGLLFSIAVFSPIAVWLDRRSRAWFDFTGEKKMAQLRKCAIEIEQTTPNTAQMLNRFEVLLCTKFDANSAHFLAENGPVHGQNGFAMPKDRMCYQALCELQWATPESLDRRRPTPAINDLREFMFANALGLLVPVPRGSSTPSLLLALASRVDERPYTFPEIERIQNLAELIDGILNRSKLNTQAAIHARQEHLSLMSRGLAHDLKNLITPVSTFLMITDGSYRNPSIEGDVHSAATRAVRTITDYIRNTLSFPGRLEPRLEAVVVDELLRDVHELMSARAAERGVRIERDVSKVESVTCDRVLVQRLLGNLVSNSIDASIEGQTVSISVSRRGANWVRFEVKDAGCGIPPEYISRVFDPYFTTKNCGQEAKGFGLGLTIAHKIVLLHQGVINIQSKPGETIVAVDLPTTSTVNLC
jgi:signal transduction histidine kinase